MKLTILDGNTIDQGRDPGCFDPILSLKGVDEAEILPRTTPEEIVKDDSFARSCEILLTNKVPLRAETLRRLPNLKYIGVLATGYNVVDAEEARKLGITVTNVPAYSTMSVAQKVFALLLTVTDRVEEYAIDNRKGRWAGSPDFCYWDTPLTELAGKTFGIVGLGNIGKAVANIALAFGMQVMAVSSKPQEKLPEGIVKADLAELLSKSDVVSLHCPLTDSNFHLINSERLSLMKPTAILINTGRGPLIDEKAVATALSENRLGSFCGDVLSQEPPTPDNPLLTHPKAYITPHIAWATVEARKRLIDIAADNIAAFLNGKPQNVVNAF